MENISSLNSSISSTDGQQQQATLTVVLRQPVELVAFLFLLALTGITITGNALICWTVAKSRRLQGPGYYFVACLALADLLVGLFVIPVSTAYYITFEMAGRWIFGTSACGAWILANMWFCIASIFSLCAVTWDRYVAVTSPLHYVARMRNRNVMKVIVVIWLTSLILAIINCYFLKKSPSRILCEIKGFPLGFIIPEFLLVYLLPLIAVVFVNICIAKAVSRQVRRVQQLSPQAFVLQDIILNDDGSYLSTQGTNHEAQENSCEPKSAHKSTMNLKKEIKTFRTFLIVTGSFFFSWTPFFFIMLIDPICKVSGTIMYICVILTYINSGSNPLVYGIFNREFRRAMMESLRMCSCCRST